MSGRVALLHIGPYEGAAALGAVGLYALAWRLMDVSQYFGTRPMQQVWTAEMYDVYKKPDARYAFGNFALRLLCVKAFAVLCIAIFSTEIVWTICASDYHDAAFLIPLFGFRVIFLIFTDQMNNTFLITRKTQYKFLSASFLLINVLLFMYFFVPWWGVTGVVLAYICALLPYTMFLYVLTQHFFPVRYPFGRMATLLIITILCYFLSLLCGNGIELNAMTAEEFAKLSRWEKIVDAWNRIQWLSNVAKIGVLLLWGMFIWFSGVLLPDDKALAIRVFKRGLQRLQIIHK